MRLCISIGDYDLDMDKRSMKKNHSRKFATKQMELVHDRFAL